MGLRGLVLSGVERGWVDIFIQELVSACECRSILVDFSTHPFERFWRSVETF